MSLVFSRQTTVLINNFILNFLSFIVTDYDVDGGRDLDIFDINEGM